MKTYDRLPVTASFPRRQQGAVLFIALVMLILITLLALTVSRTSVLEEKMTGAMRNGQLAQIGAESAARNAESKLWKISAEYIMGTEDHPFIVCGNEGLLGCLSYVPNNVNAKAKNFKDAKGWYATGAESFASSKALTGLTGDDATANLSQTPVYLVEDMGIERPPGTPPGHESGITGGGAGNRSVEKHVFRITARSTGGSGNVVNTLQTTFAAKSD